MEAIEWHEDDLGAHPVVVPIPEEFEEAAAIAHAQLVESIVELDDELMMRYLEEEPIAADELKAALRAATLRGVATPVLCGTALRNKGIQEVLDAVVDYLPSPLDVPPMQGVNPVTDAPEDRIPSDDAPFSALVFKIVTDPYVGRLAYFRVYSGTVAVGSSVMNSTKNRKERIGRLLRMHADHREDVKLIQAGDIAATLGLKTTFTGDTLCDFGAPIIWKPLTFQNPSFPWRLNRRPRLTRTNSPSLCAHSPKRTPHSR